MSAFEFFFSFYGLLLGLSVAAIATGLALAIQNRRTARIGFLTPLLAVFVALDVASFWDLTWNVFRDALFSYGLLVMGLVVALVYFIAASLVFPYAVTEGQSLDDHFWANKKAVLILTTAANAIAVAMAAPFLLGKPGGMTMAATYASTVVFYILLIVPAAFAKKARLFTILVGLHVVVYLMIAVTSVIQPMPNEVGAMTAPAPASAAPG